MTDLAFHKLAIQGVRSMWDTFYWIDEALKHHIRELQAQPEVLALLSELEYQPVDLIPHLEKLREEANQLGRVIQRARRDVGHALAATCNELSFDELTAEQVARLGLMNEQLDEVGQHIGAIKRELEAGLAGSLSNPEDRLWDKNLDVKIRFELREDDPAWRDDSDNLVAEAGDFLSVDDQWPDGYDASFPMPHGGVMHSLRLYSGYEYDRVAYCDILRIGTVQVDVMVTYQYLYDLSAGCWIKSRAWMGEEPFQAIKTTYVEGGSPGQPRLEA